MDANNMLFAELDSLLTKYEFAAKEPVTEFIPDNVEPISKPSFPDWVSTLAQPSALFDETFDDLVVIATRADDRAAAELELSFWNS